MRSATGRVKLIGERAVEVDAVFATGFPRSVMSLDLAREVGSFEELPEHLRYDLPTVKRGGSIRVVGTVWPSVEFDGCRVPSTPLEVSADLAEGRFIVGRPHLDEWGVVFEEEPRLKTCPVGRLR